MTEYICNRCNAIVEAESKDELPSGECPEGDRFDPDHEWTGMGVEN